MSANTEAKLIITIPKELHTIIKSEAVKKHTTIKELITNEILSKFKKQLCDFGYEHKLNKKTKKVIEHSRKHPEEMITTSFDDFSTYLDDLTKNSK
jgi:hypothetical protein